MTIVEISDIKIGGRNPLVLIGGPCVIETEEHLLHLGSEILKIANNLNVPFILKASFDKANRTSIESYRGPGIDEGLGILSKAKKELRVPVLTDVHELNQVRFVSEVVDVIQIPAFLCRQTDLLGEAAKTGLPINIKKGQFMAPKDMEHVVNKVKKYGNNNILLTERGSSFGYNDLVVDMRSLVMMRNFECPIVFDGTHSIQQPGGLDGCSGGDRRLVSHLTKAAVAIGIDAVFLEIHDDPDNALCDGPNSLSLTELPGLLKELKSIDDLNR